MIYHFEEENLPELLKKLNAEDTVILKGETVLKYFKNRPCLSPKGRKPISVDHSLFDATTTRWKNGEITAREAMRLLGLKPNTFYRRMKEKAQEDLEKVSESIENLTAQPGRII